MISSKFVTLLRANVEKMGERWSDMVKKSEHMKTYQKFSDKELQKRNRQFFQNLVLWLEEGASHDKIKSYFAHIGRERYHEGIPLNEINYGIIIAKRVLWSTILSEGFFSNALAIYQAIEMLTMMYNFFDLGYFYIGKEYMEEMYTKIQSSKKFTEKELKDYLFPGTIITDSELESMFGIKLSMK